MVERGQRKIKEGVCFADPGVVEGFVGMSGFSAFEEVSPL